MDQSILNRTTAALSALDFSAENERIAQIEASIAEMETAIAKGEQRCADISHGMRSDHAVDGRSVGDALLAGASGQEATLVAPSRDAMTDERSALLAGIADLRRRIADAGHEIEAIKLEALGDTARTVTPVVDEIISEATEIAGRLPALFASLYAVNLATGAGRAELDKLSQAMSGLIGNDRLLPDRRSEPVPADVSAMLSTLASKGKAIVARRAAVAAIR